MSDTAMNTARTYRISALASGFVRMWRAWSVIVPLIVVNALVQGVLVAAPAANGVSIGSVLQAVVSTLVFFFAYGLVLACAVQVADGAVSWKSAISRLRERMGAFALATLGLSIVALIGLSIYTIPGWLVLALGVFIPTAAMSGAPNPVRQGLATIRRCLWRWLVAILVTGAIVLVGSVLMGVTGFFIRGFAASCLVWLIGGLIIAWLTTAFALLYRRANEGPDATLPQSH